MIKEIQEIKKISICDICGKQGSIYKINNKDYCWDCKMNYKEEFTKNCQHENFTFSIDNGYNGRLYAQCIQNYCNFRLTISETVLNNNKIIKSEIRKIWEKKEGKQ